MLTRRKFLTHGIQTAAASSAVALLTGCPRQTHSNAAVRTDHTTGRDSLKAHAATHDLLFGMAVPVPLLKSDTEMQRVIAEQCSIVVAENSMKWRALRPAPDKFDFQQADELVAFAEQHKTKIRGHNFVWHGSIPDWFAGTVTKDNAEKFLVDHIMTVGGRYQGKIHSWDVVNEAILPKDGREDGMRKSPWFELLGPEYIDIAFRTARQADPHAMLTYNDYSVEYDNDEQEERRKFILQLLRRMKAANVPLDALGIQSHIKAGQSSTIGKGLRDYMTAARELGLQIYLTELDVNEDDLPYDDVSQRDHTIAEVYRDYLTATLADPAVKAVLTWGVGDRHTWLNGGPTHRQKQPNRPQRSLLFDNDYKPKEDFFAARECFDQRKSKA